MKRATFDILAVTIVVTIGALVAAAVAAGAVLVLFWAWGS